ncbi:LPS biosynthesis glycosyltransferase [Burkholderia sp. Nafp2/4-1b]|uniref:glycosyltransferase family 25 protein n=1 Tax=Burkholderia sp. Nafp2/4-1b TaxID=2116686 RepID=UPI000EF90371|nr:glycosyltransferase family 25 protein [Burkholderia sp. Nafp2/4-1b]RKT99075.1 LPS biosynthesis glycosyltransferase [Burkholderia sp. Nafp2/4-1b]
MKTYLVSLSRDADRRVAIGRQFPDTSASFEWIEAIDGRTLSARRYFSLCAPAFRERKILLSPSEIGCALSHMEAYGRFLASDARVALFLEDDVEGTDADLDHIARVAATLDGEFFLACGGQDGLPSRRWLIGQRLRTADEIAYYRVNRHAYAQLWRTCCYAMTRRVAERMLTRQTALLARADEWEPLLRDLGDATYFIDALSHPLDLASSSIELERVALGGALHARRVGRIGQRIAGLFRKRRIYRSILLAQLGRIGGHETIFRRR